ncbi:MAG: carboxypeptidase-like regulatory domain-containing protein [Cyclobacteriaceae bacterium]|nr:carboxypeptidase-like regulatory domain-containing protein [Cyclobacteriaceae bacterium]
MRGLFTGKTSFLLLLLFLSGSLVAQETIIQGKVTDANSGDAVPFANVVFKGTSIGVTTDFDGNYLLKTNNPTDSLRASYISYKSKIKVVKKGVRQTINFQLEEDVTNLETVVVHAGENPAFEILRNVVNNKNDNDKRKLSAYEYDTYTKIEVDVDNISDQLRENVVMKKIAQVLDSAERVAGEDGKPILPLFITESVSKLYYRDNPVLKTEHILKTKINGVGIEDGGLVTQLIGSSFQEYNFYQNWLNILSKDFVSPVADGWRIYYDYYLTDSLYLGNDFCYRLDFTPKSEQDLAFSGTIWITKKEFAIRQIDATVGKQANLNFVEKIKIQQELEITTAGPWLPIKNRVLINMGQMSKRAAGVLAKFYTSNKNFVIDKPQPNSFYALPIEVAEDARQFEDEKYWDTLRHEALSETEKNVYKMIDTLKNIPAIKTYTDIVKILIDGYYDLGKVDIGPYIGLIASNNVEGFRVQGGFRTNAKFSRHWILAGQIGYGFQDSRVKYSASVTNILSRRRWTTFSVRMRSDIARIGIDDENLADNPIFLAASRWGVFRRGYYFDETRVSFSRELFKGFTQRVSFRNWTFNPTYNFGYYQQPEDSTSIADRFNTSEISFETRFARDEFFIQNGNNRISMGAIRWPIITFRYTHGIKGMFGSDFEYDKIRLNLTKRIKLGPLGYGKVTATGEYVFNTLPYPLLALHLGNQTPVYAAVTYNLMNYGEFISDHYASIQYRQYFEGFFFNHIPLMNKLKWRLLGTANVIVGGMRDSNRRLIASTTRDGQSTLMAGYFTGEPYTELGYGIENIFKFLRIDFIHRLSYLDNPGARNFGIFFTAQFQL